MNKRVIAISREFGSGGRTIGRKVAEKLGIVCYDRELIEKIAAESGLDKVYVSQRSEDSVSAGWLGNSLAERDFNGHSLLDTLWKAQSSIILGLATKESCVIVGRCADYILRENPGCLTVFIHAGEAERARRIVEVYGESSQTPQKRIRDKDKQRKAYYKTHTDIEWGDAKNYHIALNSGVLGIEKCVEIISELY